MITLFLAIFGRTGYEYSIKIKHANVQIQAWCEVLFRLVYMSSWAMVLMQNCHFLIQISCWYFLDLFDREEKSFSFSFTVDNVFNSTSFDPTVLVVLNSSMSNLVF